jgi:uncharacterized paraquat-inducible protein A
MIQRVQTIYLLLAIICMVCMFVFPIGLFQADGIEYLLTYNGLQSETGQEIEVTANVILLFTIPMILLVLIIQMLYFKKRPLQLRLGRVLYLLLATLIASTVYLMTENQTHLPSPEIAEVQYGIGFYLPIAAIVFEFLANRSIRKDEELVKSLDRLR